MARPTKKEVAMLMKKLTVTAAALAVSASAFADHYAPHYVVRPAYRHYYYQPYYYRPSDLRRRAHRWSHRARARAVAARRSCSIVFVRTGRLARLTGRPAKPKGDEDAAAYFVEGLGGERLCHPGGARCAPCQHERHRGAAERLEDFPAGRRDGTLPRRAAQAVEGRVAQAPSRRRVPRAARGRHRARRHERAQRGETRRRVRLRRLRPAALHLGNEVRVGHRLAELLHQHPGGLRDEEGLLPDLPAHRVPLHALRRAPRPPVRRRPAADRPALVQ